MLVFDRRSLRCVVPPTEDCDAPTTQQPPENDLPENVPQQHQQQQQQPGRGNGPNDRRQQYEQQFEENYGDDGDLPQYLLNTYEQSNP